jgi:hypothetical protein
MQSSVVYERAATNPYEETLFSLAKRQIRSCGRKIVVRPWRRRTVASERFSNFIDEHPDHEADAPENGLAVNARAMKAGHMGNQTLFLAPPKRS